MSQVQKLLDEDLEYEQSPFKIDYSMPGLVRMNLNENLVMPQNFARSVLVRAADRVDSRYYPSDLGEGQIRVLQTEIAKYCNCSPDMICFGDGSDQIIDLLWRMKLQRSDDSLLTVDPTFSLYALMARRNGSNVALITLNSSKGETPFSLPLRELIQECKSKKARLVALASPNNPTGIQYPIEQVREILESLPEVCILLDEAYIEYADYAATRLLDKYQNLVIMRTFSKAFGMASHRLGYTLSADRGFVQKFNNDFQYPYPITELGVVLATLLLKRKTDVLKFAYKTKTFRMELISSLQRFEKQLRVIPSSQGNFVVVQSKNAKKIALELLSKHKIAVKYIPKMGSEKEFLRITVGTRELNERLLYALRRILGSKL